MSMPNVMNSFQNPSVKEAASAKHADMEGSAPLYVGPELPSQMQPVAQQVPATHSSMKKIEADISETLQQIEYLEKKRQSIGQQLAAN